MNLTPRKAAEAIRLRYRLIDPTLDELVSIISELGYEIVDYDPRSDSAVMLIQELKLPPEITCQSAFVCHKGDIRLLFVQSSLAIQEKRYALAHELGHIALGHMQSGGQYPVTEEYEANEFTHYLLNPGILTRIRGIVLEHRRVSIGILCLLMLAAMTMGIVRQIHRESLYYGEYYVTTTGNKYHKRGCMLIKDKKNARRLIEEELDSFEPCKVCLSELH